ncbi:hypothetical protein Tco_0713308 [Tanacetum coccineum]
MSVHSLNDWRIDYGPWITIELTRIASLAIRDRDICNLEETMNSTLSLALFFKLILKDGGEGSGYQQKDRKQSQNDKTEHGMEKTVQNQGQNFPFFDDVAKRAKNAKELNRQFPAIDDVVRCFLMSRNYERAILSKHAVAIASA